MTVSDTALVNTLSIDGVETTIEGTNNYNLAFNNSGAGRFRYYSSGAVQLYKKVDSTGASTYASYMMGELEGVCDLDGNTDLDDLQIAWAMIAFEYEDLSASDKEQFRLGIANEGGSSVQQALAAYDYIAGKYGTQLESDLCDNYNYMDRSVSSGANPMINPVTSDNATIISVVVAVLAISISSVVAVLFVRKKKEQR